MQHRAWPPSTGRAWAPAYMLHRAWPLSVHGAWAPAYLLHRAWPPSTGQRFIPAYLPSPVRLARGRHPPDSGSLCMGTRLPAAPLPGTLLHTGAAAGWQKPTRPHVPDRLRHPGRRRYHDAAPVRHRGVGLKSLTFGRDGMPTHRGGAAHPETRSVRAHV